MYLTRRKNEYEKIIREIDATTEHLKQVLSESIDLRDQIVQYKEISKDYSEE